MRAHYAGEPIWARGEPVCARRLTPKVGYLRHPENSYFQLPFQCMGYILSSVTQKYLHIYSVRGCLAKLFGFWLLLPSSKASRSASFRRFTWTIETLELQYIIVYKIKWVLELKYGRPESMDFWSILQSTGVSGLWNHSTVDHCQWVQSYTVDQSQWALGLKTTRVNGSGAILQQRNNEIKILKI